jgi:DNA polymerase I
MNYKLTKSVSEIENYVGNHKILALDIETSPLDKYRGDEKASLDSNKSKIVGISISVGKGTGIYVPLRHRNYENADFDEMWPWIRDNILMDKNKIGVIHNVAFESAFFCFRCCNAVQSLRHDGCSTTYTQNKNTV